MSTDPLWLVGFGYRTEQGQLVRHYYVVPGEADPELARRAALRRAVAPGERAVRGGRDLDARTTELRRMVRDPLGALSLAASGASACDRHGR